jgi:thioredoxin reductase
LPGVVNRQAVDMNRREWLESGLQIGLALGWSGCAANAPLMCHRSGRRRVMSGAGEQESDSVDVAVIGGGPAGLSAALVLGRACKRVVLYDAGEPRNSRAAQIHGFVTQDGTSPAAFRRIAREQLASYPAVELRSERVHAIGGTRGRFQIGGAAGNIWAKRVILCLGLIDELPALPGYRELWGHAIFQCPYCHGWEARDQAIGLLAPTPQMLDWSPFLLGWSRDVVVFTEGRFVPDAATQQRLNQVGVRIETRAIRELLVSRSAGEVVPQLAAVELADGTQIRRDLLFARPPQRQQPLVASLALALDDLGFVRVDDLRQTSVPGIYAAGDLTTLMQGALLAAAAGAQAAYALNHELTIERCLPAPAQG